VVDQLRKKTSIRRNGGNDGGDEEDCFVFTLARCGIRANSSQEIAESHYKTLPPPEEGDKEEESKAEKGAKAVRAPTTPLFLGPLTCGSEEQHILGE
jgi:hypothetical protein